MQITQILTRDVEVIPPNASLSDAARRMRERDIGSLPVCDGDRIVGMITDRDITVRAVADGMDPQQTQVRQVMSDHPIFCYEDEDVQAAAELMEEKQIRRLPILDRQKHLVGIVALGDIALTGDDSTSGDVLEHISRPTRRSRNLH